MLSEHGTESTNLSALKIIKFSDAISINSGDAGAIELLGMKHQTFPWKGYICL